jgi:hypothetical protein
MLRSGGVNNVDDKVWWLPENCCKTSNINDMSILEAGTEIKEKETVGQEFIEWAEKYWLLDKLVKIEYPDNFAGKNCDYNYMRNVFIKKINAIIKDRLG